MVDGGGVWSAYPHCRVYAAAEGNDAGSAVPVAELRPWPRRTSLEACVLAGKKQKILDGGNHARSASFRRRHYAVRIVRRRRRSPFALDPGNLCCVSGQASNRTRASSETNRGASDSVGRRCRTAVELSIAGTECARLARLSTSARVMGGTKAHSRSRSGGRRGGRARDTIIVIQRVCGSL